MDRLPAYQPRHSHHVFETRREALRWLEEHSMDSVSWPERGKHKEACYWNGKVYVTEKK